MQGFCLKVIFQPHHAALAAIAGLLVAAKGRAIFNPAAIDVDSASPQFAGNTLGAFLIARLQKGGQPIGCVIGDLNAIRLILEGDDHQDRAKDFLAGDPHIV